MLKLYTYRLIYFMFGHVSHFSINIDLILICCFPIYSIPRPLLLEIQKILLFQMHTYTYQITSRELYFFEEVQILLLSLKVCPLNAQILQQKNPKKLYKNFLICRYLHLVIRIETICKSSLVI